MAGEARGGMHPRQEDASAKNVSERWPDFFVFVVEGEDLDVRDRCAQILLCHSVPSGWSMSVVCWSGGGMGTNNDNSSNDHNDNV